MNDSGEGTLSERPSSLCGKFEYGLTVISEFVKFMGDLRGFGFRNSFTVDIF